MYVYNNHLTTIKDTHFFMPFTIFTSVFTSAVVITVLGNMFAIGATPFYASREFVSNTCQNV